jgi:CRISPR-associated protein Csx1
MIAHAGLQKEIVQVKLLENGQVLLRYNSAWENRPIQQLSSSGLLLHNIRQPLDFSFTL